LVSLLLAGGDDFAPVLWGFLLHEPIDVVWVSCGPVSMSYSGSFIFGLVRLSLTP
jgi:hypothetical protein